MKSSDNLYQLIQALTKAEKRNFKIIAAQHSKKDSSNYILLFDAIERQKTYDEARLKKKFRNYPFAKNISKTKHLLYHLILKTLRSLNESRTTRSKLSALLEDAQTLTDKSLIDQAYAVLVKAARLAKSNELYPNLLNILDRQLQLLPLSSQSAITGKLRELVVQRQSVAAIVNTEIQYKSLLSLIQLSFPHSGGKASLAQQHVLSTVLDDPLLQSEQEPKSFLTKIFSVEIQALACEARDAFTEAVAHWQKARLLWLQHEEMIALFPDDYLRNTAAYLICSLNARQKDLDYERVLNELRNQLPQNGQKAQRNLFFTTTLDFIGKLSTKQLEDCTALLQDLEAGLEEHTVHLNIYWRIDLCYHIGIYHFLQADYRKALQWMDRIQQFDASDICAHVQYFCRLIGLMALYELKEFDTLKDDIQHMLQTLHGRKSTKVEQLILDSVKQLLYANHNRETRSIFSELQLSLTNWEANDIPIQLVTSNAIQHWVDHQLSDDDRYQTFELNPKRLDFSS
ncbi:MAG: hypothetical protein AAGG75_11695 [Bacteroidota bacterium]